MESKRRSLDGKIHTRQAIASRCEVFSQEYRKAFGFGRGEEEEGEDGEGAKVSLRNVFEQ